MAAKKRQHSACKRVDEVLLVRVGFDRPVRSLQLVEQTQAPMRPVVLDHLLDRYSELFVLARKTTILS